MAVTSVTRNFRHGAISLIDGSGTPKVLLIECDMGDLTWSSKEEIKEDYCRGVLQGFRKGKDLPLELSFTVKVTNLINYSISSTGTMVPLEVLRNIGDVFTSTTDGDVFTLDVQFDLADPDDAGNDERILFPDCAIPSIDFSESEDTDTIKVSAKSLQSMPTITRI